MPVHNGARWLDAAVQSVRAQSERRLELIIVDDGSTDQTPALLCELARADPRIRVLRQEHRGLAAALNRGVSAARGPYIARLDADDVAYPMRLERQAAALDRRPEVGLAGTWAAEIDARGVRCGVRTPATGAGELRQILRRGNPFVHSTIMARTALFRGLGGYRSAFQGAEDYDLWLRASEVVEVANLPEVLVGYRVHAQSVSHRHRLRQAFSVRLAQRAAAVRRQAGFDPTEALKAPPDWRCGGDGVDFYADAVELYRWLDPGYQPQGATVARLGMAMLERIADLTHDERRLAALAMLARLRDPDRDTSAVARRLLMRLCRERPRTVLRAAWSLRT
jgi:glycosyltransferase involved in cell wall biosynthesis